MARLTRLAVAPLRGTSGKVTLKVTTAARAASVCQYWGPFTSSATPTFCCAVPCALSPVPHRAFCADHVMQERARVDRQLRHWGSRGGLRA